MHIAVEPRESCTVLHLRGEFDTFYCTLLQREIESLIAAGAVHVALNLRLVKFINSTALGAIIKAHKALVARGGRLVLLRPSDFCRDIIQKVGVDRVVPIFHTEEQAEEALRGAASRPVAGASLDETAVLFAPIDAARAEMFLPEEERKVRPGALRGQSTGAGWQGVGRMASLEPQGLRFTWTGGTSGLTSFEMAQFLAIGTRLRVEFRLPLHQKGPVAAEVEVTEVEERQDGVKIGAEFRAIDEEARAAVARYAADLAFLKKELRKATGNQPPHGD